MLSFRIVPLALLASLLLSVSGAAQEETPTQDIPTLEWQAFLQRQGPGWVAKWSKATGTPKAIYGTGLGLQAEPIETLARARHHAEATLERYAKLLGRGNSTFVESTALKLRQVYVFVYDQEYQGLSVIGGRADVRIHEVGVVSMFGSQAVQIPARFNLKPKITAKEAIERAWAHVLGEASAKAKPPATRLVIWAQVEEKAPTPVRLAYEVQVDEQPLKVVVGKAYVDAMSGAILEFKNEVYTCGFGHTHIECDHERESAAAASSSATPGGFATLEVAIRPELAAITGKVMAWTNTGLRPLDPLKNVPLANILVTAAGVGSGYTDANGNFSIPYTGTTAVNVSVSFRGRHIQNITTYQGTKAIWSGSVTPGTPKTVQFLTSAANQFDRSQSTTYYHVNYVNEWVRGLLKGQGTTSMNWISGVRATVNRNASCNAYYTSSANTINFYAASSTCNNTGYSTVVDHEWGHGLDQAFGGITQTDGLSEGWGDIIAIFATGQPIVGHDFRKNGGIVRTALNTRTYPVGGTSVHAKGETWMGWAWDVRINLIATLGSTAGAAKAEQIIVPSIAANARNQPDAVREVFILDDDDGNLANGTPNYKDLEKAALKRTLPYPKIKLGVLTHTPLQSTEAQLTPSIVRASLQTILGTFSKVDLVYAAGAAAQRREMAPSGGGNFIALLPGLLSPASVAYHLEALHSTNAIVRFPESGEITFSIGRGETFFFDDFEKGETGWTHGLVLRQDDWQFGVSAGLSGSSQGVTWRDPNKAASGTRCRGNDLGIGNYNGAYQPYVENWLKSPTLNLTGKTGVTLAFKRWLSVEESQYDQATIRVINQTVWTNPYAGHVNDTSWKPQEIKIPMADNKPAVNIEWRLKSDAGLHLGGWAIDDVRLFSFTALPPPKVQYRMAPAQVGLGQTSTATFKGTPSAPFVLLVSPNKGPISVPGLPTLHVGSNFVLALFGFDAKGDAQFGFKAPTSSSIVGLLFYSQILEKTNATTLTASNPMVTLFGK